MLDLMQHLHLRPPGLCSLSPWSVAIALIIVFVGCIHASGPSDVALREEPDEPEKEDIAMQDSLRKQVDEARAELAERLSLTEDAARDAVEVVSAERVTWRDGSLGCPREGQFYTQALQPGVLIELRVEGKIYSYHGKPEGPPFYCQTPSPVGPLRAEVE